MQELTYNDLTTVVHREGARARMPLDGMIELVQQLGDAWVAGCGEIAAAVPRPGDERNNGV